MWRLCCVRADSSDRPAVRRAAGLGGPGGQGQSHGRDPQHLLHLLGLQLQHCPGAGQLEEAAVLPGTGDQDHVHQSLTITLHTAG